MDYKKLAEIYEKITSNSKRLSKTYHISELIKNTNIEELDMVILLLNGRLYPVGDKKDIGVAARLVIKALNIATGIGSSKIEEEWKNTGDLGKTAFNLIGKKKQVTLFSGKLNVENVFDNLRKLAETTGPGSVDRKIKIISGLLSSASPLESQYIVRTVLEDLRVGVGDGTIREAIAWSSVNGLDVVYDMDKNNFEYELNDEIKKIVGSEGNLYAKVTEIIQNSYDILNNFAEIVKMLRKDGLKGLLKIEISVGNPIKVMLYQKAKDIKDAFERVGKPAAFEYKYDGFRIQTHKKNGKIMLFTRRLENVTKQFPDIVESVIHNVKGDNFILDSEVVGYDAKTGEYLPFQSISQRIKRKHDIERMAHDFPVELNVFDILAKDGKSLLKIPFKQRRELLEGMIKVTKKQIMLANQLITSDEGEARKFYQEALEAHEEGVMAKNLEGIYKPGSRVGYGVKVKPTMKNLDLVIIGAEWGKGKRSGWLSSFHIACQDDEGNILEIGKVGTGIKELEGSGATFDELTKLLKPLVLEEKGSFVKVKPKVIIEVSYEEIQKSSKYSSGHALRFPRLIRLRPDRDISDISDMALVKELYVGQR